MCSASGLVLPSAAPDLYWLVARLSLQRPLPAIQARSQIFAVTQEHWHAKPKEESFEPFRPVDALSSEERECAAREENRRPPGIACRA